jgi:hypothetical protein
MVSINQKEKLTGMARGVEWCVMVTIPILAPACGETIMARIVEESYVSLHPIAYSSKAVVRRISLLL